MVIAIIFVTNSIYSPQIFGSYLVLKLEKFVSCFISMLIQSIRSRTAIQLCSLFSLEKSKK